MERTKSNMNRRKLLALEDPETTQLLAPIGTSASSKQRSTLRPWPLRSWQTNLTLMAGAGLANPSPISNPIPVLHSHAQTFDLKPRAQQWRHGRSIVTCQRLLEATHHETAARTTPAVPANLAPAFGYRARSSPQKRKRAPIWSFVGFWHEKPDEHRTTQSYISFFGPPAPWKKSFLVCRPALARHPFPVYPSRR